MWPMAFVFFVFCKWLPWHYAARANVPLWKQIVYLMMWPGLDADAFFKQRVQGSVPSPTCHEWFAGAIKLLLGLYILFCVARCLPRELPYVVGWAGMIGMVLILHFGLF